MDWLEKVSSKSVLSDKINEQGEFRFEQINTNPEQYETIVSDFFMLLHNESRLGDGGVTHWPTPNDKVLKKVLEEVAPFFKTAKLEKTDKHVFSVFLQHPKDSSKKLIKNKIVHPVLHDIFKRERNIENPRFPFPNNSVYKVNPEFYTKMQSDTEVDKLIDFFRDSMSKEKDFIFRPENWYLTDELKNSIALRYLVHRCTGLFLWVDDDTKYIFHIHLKFS